MSPARDGTKEPPASSSLPWGVLVILALLAVLAWSWWKRGRDSSDFADRELLSDIPKPGLPHE